MDILNELRSVTHKTVIHLTYAEPLSVPRRSKKKDRLAARSTVRRRDPRQHTRERRAETAGARGHWPVLTASVCGLFTLRQRSAPTI